MRKTSNWKKEYSTRHLRDKGYRNFEIISTDKLKYFGHSLGKIFTNDIVKSMQNTSFDLAKVKVIDEKGKVISHYKKLKL